MNGNNNNTGDTPPQFYDPTQQQQQQQQGPPPMSTTFDQQQGSGHNAPQNSYYNNYNPQQNVNNSTDNTAQPVSAGYASPGIGAHHQGSMMMPSTQPQQQQHPLPPPPTSSSLSSTSTPTPTPTMPTPPPPTAGYTYGTQAPYGGTASTMPPPPPQQQQPQQYGGYPDYEGSYQHQQHYQYAHQQQQQQQQQQPVDHLAGSMQQLSLNQAQQYQQQPQANYAHTEKIVNVAHHDQLPRPVVETFAQEEIQQSDASVLFQRMNQGQQADFSKVQCSSRYMRATTQSVPNSPAILNKWPLPFGVIIQPFNDKPGEEIPLINATKTGVQRCYKCRTYINPFIIWLDGGMRWQCNMCKKVNDVPMDYRCGLDQFGSRLDINHRPELRCGTVEYIAPGEYMARAPQPPVYLFLIDVSASAIANGMVKTVARTIRHALDQLPGDTRTRVGFITFDRNIHFYNLKSTLSQPQMYVVGEMNETLLPVPFDLVVVLHESRNAVNALLDKLENKLFTNTMESDVVLGPALNTAGRLISRVGGRVIAFVSNIPNLGPHSLKNREDMSLYGKESERTLFNEASKTYKELALLYSRDQISADVFVCSDQYVDIATLGCLPRYTGGEVKYYPHFNDEIDGKKLEYDLSRVLTRKQGLESVMRIRCSTGVKVSNFFGNFFLRGHDLLALPNIDADKTFAIELSHESGVLTTPNVCAQTAVLYTSTNGDRRIRVHTMILPITSSLADMYRHADIEATMALMAKIASDEVPRRGLEYTKARIRNTIKNSLAMYKKEVSNNHMSQYHLVMPETLGLLPLLGNCLTKSDILIGGDEVKADARMAALHRLNVGSLAEVMLTIHPLLFSASTGEDQLQMENAENPQQGRLPVMLPLTQRYMSDDEVYVMCDSSNMLLWIGKNVAMTDELSDLLDIVNLLNSNKNRVDKSNTKDAAGSPSDDEHAESDGDDDRDIATYPARARNLYNMVVLLRLRYGYMTVKYCSGNPSMERLFLRKLVEDKVLQSALGYDEFCLQVQQEVAK